MKRIKDVLVDAAGSTLEYAKDAASEAVTAIVDYARTSSESVSSLKMLP